MKRIIYLIFLVLSVNTSLWAICPSGTHNVDIAVNSNCTVSTTVNMGPGRTIYVMDGVILTLSAGAVLNSSVPGQAWDGIVVQDGGTLIIEDWATIKNAAIGVTVKSGGIIEATKGKFTNNRHDIWFEPDPNVGLDCKLENVIFEWNSSYYPSLFYTSGINIPQTSYIPVPKENMVHVVLDEVYKVVFKGCIFSNTRNWLEWEPGGLGTDPNSVNDMVMSWKARGIGILSNNSGFVVKNMGPCALDYNDPLAGDPDYSACIPCSGQPNLFTGLCTGIAFDNFRLDGIQNPNAMIDILGAEFVNNLLGVSTSYNTSIFPAATSSWAQFNDISRITISQCRFDINESIKNFIARKPGSFTNGIYLDHVNDFDINRNVFDFDYQYGNTIGVCETDNPLPGYLRGASAITIRESGNLNPSSIEQNFIYNNMEISCTFYNGGIILINDNSLVDVSCNNITVNTFFGNPVSYYLGFLQEAPGSTSSAGSIGTPGICWNNRFAPLPNCGSNDLYHIGFSESGFPTNFSDWTGNGVDFHYLNQLWHNPTCIRDAQSKLNKVIAASSNTCTTSDVTCGFFDHPGDGSTSYDPHQPFHQYPEVVVSLSPNPVSGTTVLTYDFSSMPIFSSFFVTIVDLNGNVVWSSGTITTGTGELSIDVNHLLSGYYYMIINAEGYIWRIPFIKI